MPLALQGMMLILLMPAPIARVVALDAVALDAEDSSAVARCLLQKWGNRIPFYPVMQARVFLPHPVTPPLYPTLFRVAIA